MLKIVGIPISTKSEYRFINILKECKAAGFDLSKTDRLQREEIAQV
jgi:hypothetical protein